MSSFLRLSLTLFMVLSCISYTRTSRAYVLSLTTSGDATYWHTRCIPFWLSTTLSPNLDRNMIERDLIDSLRAWDSSSCTELSFVYEGEIDSNFIGYDTSEGADNHNILTFVSSPQPWLYDPSVLALTTVTMCVNDTPECPVGTIIDADIEVNEQGYQFTTSDAQRVQMDLANTVTHELGHFLGIDHSNVSEATMYFQQNLGETSKRDLADDDRAALCTIFPNNDSRSCNLAPYQFSIIPEQNQMNMADNSQNDQGCQQSKSSRFEFYLLCLLLVITVLRTRFQLSTLTQSHK